MFQSTRPVRGATIGTAVWQDQCRVSIHAPRAGRDHGAVDGLSEAIGFNPRAPCGARLYADTVIDFMDMFQSTRPVRGATVGLHRVRKVPEFQSTRPVRGATMSPMPSSGCMTVSIHAPRAGRD